MVESEMVTFGSLESRILRLINEWDINAEAVRGRTDIDGVRLRLMRASSIKRAADAVEAVAARDLAALSSWAEVGRALGISRQAAWERFADHAWQQIVPVEQDELPLSD